MPDGLSDPEARRMLRARALRCTDARVRVLRALAAAPGHVSVAELHQLVDGQGDVTTVYRTVTTLQSAGLVHSVAVADQPVTYGLAHAAHHHAVCSACHRMTEVPAAAVAEAVALFAGATGFSLDGVGSLELHGLCADCRAAAAAAPGPDGGARTSG